MTKKQKPYPVSVSWMPGREPQLALFDNPRPKPEPFEHRTKFPFEATIITPAQSYIVEVSKTGLRLVRRLKALPSEGYSDEDTPPTQEKAASSC